MLKLTKGLAALAVAVFLYPANVYAHPADGCPPTTEEPPTVPPEEPPTTPPTTPPETPPAPLPPRGFPENVRFGLPDINFVTASRSANLVAGRFTMISDRSLGDIVAINNGEGFLPVDARIAIISGEQMVTDATDRLIFAQGGTIEIRSGDELLLKGDLTGVELTRSLVGFDYAITFTATDGTMKDLYGDRGAIFGVLYNVEDVAGIGFSAFAKGDIAPMLGDQGPNPNPNPIPEPATLALLGMGLTGLLGSARRRLA